MALALKIAQKSPGQRAYEAWVKAGIDYELDPDPLDEFWVWQRVSAREQAIWEEVARAARGEP